MPTTAPVRDASGGTISSNNNALAGVSQSLTSVPAQSLLYAWVWLDVNTGDTGVVSSVTDNVGLTWTLIGERSKHSDGGSAQNGHIAVWRATFTAGGSITVSASGSGGSLTTTMPVSLNVEVITGGRLSGGVPEIVIEASSTGTVKCPSGGTTGVGRYSYIRGSNVDWNAAAAPTAATGWTTRISGKPASPFYTYWGADMVAQAAAQQMQLLSTAPTSGTINNSIVVEHLPAFTALENAAENGTNNVAPVAATTGSAGNDPWDTVTTTGNGAVVYSTDQAAHGTQSYKFTSGVTSGQAFIQWSVNSIGRLDRVYGRFYIWQATNNPDTSYMRLRGSSTQIIRITNNGSGQLQLRNSANTVIATFTAAITNSAWVRVEFDVTPSVAAGAATVKLFNTTDSTTVTETQSVTGQALGIAYVDEVSWGQVASAANLPALYLDDLQLNASALPGPVGGGGPADQGVTLAGVAAAAAVGSPAITTTADVTLTGVASAAAVGQPAVAPGAVEIVLESAPTLSAVGEPVVYGDDVAVILAGVASAAAVGQPAIAVGAVDVVLTGVASAAAVGQPAIAPGAVDVVLTGAGTVSAVGQPAIGVGATTVVLAGVASAAAVGQPAFAAGAVTVVLAGVTSASAVGEPAVTVGLTIAATGVASAAAVGQPAVGVGAVEVALAGVAPGSAFGMPTVATVAVPTVVLAGVTSAAAVGQPAIAVGGVTVVLAGVASGSAFGAPTVTGGVPAVYLTGIPSSAAVGLLELVRETIDYGIRAAPHRVSMTYP